MITIHGDMLEIYVLGESLQIWTKVRTEHAQRIDYDGLGNVSIYSRTDVFPSTFDTSEQKLTEKEILDILEIIRQYLLSKRP